MKSSKQSHLGLATEAILEDLESKYIVSRSDFQNFYEMFIKFFKTAASKLFQESPLNPVIVRTLRVFNPTLIHAENKLSLMKLIKGLTQQLHMLGMISANTVIMPMTSMKILSKPSVIQFRTRIVIVWMAFFPNIENRTGS